MQKLLDIFVGNDFLFLSEQNDLVELLLLVGLDFGLSFGEQSADESGLILLRRRLRLWCGRVCGAGADDRLYGSC